MSSYAKFNAGGMAVFGFGFVLTLGLFQYTLCINPGPTSGQAPTVAQPFSAKEQAARAEGWRTSSPQAQELGAKLYAINCAGCHSAGGKDQVLGLLESGQAKMSTSTVGLYTAIMRGFDGGHRFSHIGKQERWALVHFLQGKAQGMKSNSSGEWAKLIATDF